MAMPFAPVKRMQNTQAPTENPCFNPQYGTRITAARKVNKNTNVGAQLIGACCAWTEVLCDMLRLEWNDCGRNVARPMRGCGTCVRNARSDDRFMQTLSMSFAMTVSIWRRNSGNQAQQ